jgi:hypothetical protein
MPPITRLRDLDTLAWSTATWTTPLIVQLVLGAMFIALWLLGKAAPFMTHGSYSGERALLLTAAAVTALVSVAISGSLIMSRSSRVHGAAMSIAGSAAIVLIGSIGFAFWILRW